MKYLFVIIKFFAFRLNYVVIAIVNILWHFDIRHIYTYDYYKEWMANTDTRDESKFRRYIKF